MSDLAQPLPMAETSVKVSPVRISERHVAGALILTLCAVLVLIIALPLWALLSKSLEDTQGKFVGLANFVSYATTPSLFYSLLNSLLVASVTTAIVVPLAFLYAYALRRSCIPAKGAFYAAAMIPVFAPSLLSGLALIYLFGNQGILKSWMMGASLYGPVGIIAAEALYSFPHAMLILVTALALWVEFTFEPGLLIHILLWVPLTAALTVLMLRIAKGWLLALEYRHRASEGRIASDK